MMTSQDPKLSVSPEMIGNSTASEPPLIYLGKNNKYMIEELIDEGSFGKVYKVISTKDPNSQFAAKIQQANGKHCSVIEECRTYRFMSRQKKKDEKRDYIPKIYYCAQEDDYYVLVMELMGLSIKELLLTSQDRIFNCSRSKSQFQLKTVLLLAEQMISALEYVHNRGVIHRDLKPSNFCIGHGNKKNQIFLIDFGLAIKYIINGQHIPQSEVSGMVGNRVYASIACHKHLHQSRKDDMESLGYVLIDIAKGSLPWKKTKGVGIKQKTDIIAQQKMAMEMRDLCSGLPQSFSCYMQAVKNLKFQEEPHYQFCRNLFRFALMEIEFQEKLQ